MNASKTGMATGGCVLRGAVAYGHSETGPVRQHNEDLFLLDAQLELLAVADGMGGHEAGALASALTLQNLRDFLERQMERNPGEPSDPDATCQHPSLQASRTLLEALDRVNAQLYAQNVGRQLSENKGMGTTLTGIWRPQAGGPLLVFHVGDSRLYRYRNDRLEQLSRDQTWYQQALDAGHFDHLPARNLLSQAIGPAQRIEPDISVQAVQSGDLLMLCSDGIHGSVPHQDIEMQLKQANRSTLEATCRQLIQLAARYDGRDNATVVLIKYD